MGLMIRTWNLARGLASKVVAAIERRNPEALLELEKENLRKLVGRFNEGLVSHASLAERMKRQVADAESRSAELTSRIRALLSAGEANSAGRCAFQLKETTARLAEFRLQFDAAERAYGQLVGARDNAVADVRAKIENLRWRIGDLKANRAMADLQGMASAMLDNLSGPAESLNRLQDLVAEEQERARGRVRVTGPNLSVADLASKEAEQHALEAQALAEYRERQPAEIATRAALPNYAPDPEIVIAPKRRLDDFRQ